MRTLRGQTRTPKSALAAASSSDLQSSKSKKDAGMLRVRVQVRVKNGGTEMRNIFSKERKAIQ